MGQRYLRNIALLLLVWLASQQAVALVFHGVDHSQHIIQKAQSHMGLNSGSNTPVCDHCATFCQPTLLTVFYLDAIHYSESLQVSVLVESITTPTISVLYRPPIVV